MKEKVRVYTRDIDKDEYPFGLAKAVHFEVEHKDDKGVRGTTALNNNYAVLFAEGNISKDNTIIPLGIDNPVIFEMPGGTIYISGRRIDTDGNSYDLDEGRLWTFETHDLIHFETVGLVDPDTIAAYSPSDVLDVDDTIIQTAIKFWNPEKPADDLNVCKYSFPLARGFGDPVIFKWEGKWYFISTSDNTGDIGIYVREADTVPELFKEDVVQHLILPYDEKRQLIQTFWAPEFHVIGGELYILFAVSAKQWGPQCHLMKSFFKDDNGNLMIAYHAERNIKEHLRCDMIRRVCFKADGTPYFV